MNRQTNGIALTVGASLIWGTSFVAASVGLQYSSPYLLLFERFFVASMAILTIGLFTRSARVWGELRRAETWVLAAVWGAGFVLQFVGQGASGASASALLSNLFVVFVPVAAFFVLRERMTNASKGAVALSVFGIVLVLPSGLHLSGNTVGDLLLVGAALGNTMFIVLGKKYGVSSLASSFAVVVSITVMLAPIAAIAGGIPSLNSLLAPADWASVFWLGVPCTVLATAMYTRGPGFHKGRAVGDAAADGNHSRSCAFCLSARGRAQPDSGGRSDHHRLGDSFVLPSMKTWLRISSGLL